MRTTGLIFFTFDLLKALYSGYNNIDRDETGETKEIERVHAQRHTGQWKPYIGVGMMVLGGAILVLGRKKSLSK